MTSRLMSHAVVLMVALTLVHTLLALSLWARRPEAAEGSAGALAPLRARALLLDETTEPAVHLIARRTATKERPNTTRITLNSAAGQRTVTP